MCDVVRRDRGPADAAWGDFNSRAIYLLTGWPLIDLAYGCPYFVRNANLLCTRCFDVGRSLIASRIASTVSGRKRRFALGIVGLFAEVGEVAPDLFRPIAGGMGKQQEVGARFPRFRMFRTLRASGRIGCHGTTSWSHG